MRPLDFIQYSGFAITSNRLRSFLTGLGITIGIAAVVLLTSIGEGVQRFIVAEFTQFGTNLIAIVPGKTSTHGFSGAVISNVRPLSIDDELSLTRLSGVLDAVAVVQGNAAVESENRQRRTTILGTGAATPQVWQFKVAIGRFLPADDPRRARAFVVLGSKVRRELYGEANPLGRTVRIGGSRFRVIGVMESKGQILGFDLDDAVYIPTAKALELFNRESVMEIDVLYGSAFTSSEVAARIKKRLIARHGSEDFTINTQDQMLSILGSVLDKLTLAVGALGGISLLVGGVGILTIMTIAVHDRTGEIGLLRALGATRGQILFLFLWEAVFLSLAGGLTGLMLGWGGAKALHFFLPALPTHTPLNYALYAEILALAIGLCAGVLPARRAADLDPVEALRTE
ncbi:MAG: ABC transporter permease [Deltaproteobacteria bacterium]